jgi:drug/metabolite transporter (DMT)-like permease
VFVFLLAVLQLRGRAPARWWILNVAFLVALGAYVVFDQQGPDLMTPDGLEARVAVQKVIVVLAFANLTAQAWALSRRRRALLPV